MGRTLLFILGLVVLLWSTWDNYKNPPEPEPFTWTGTFVKAAFILFCYVAISVCMNMLGGD